ncbi:uncharacterized protein STAUR_1440 [Stigmatella aurantiaca DW4/3-1]|uniref:Uncharacterized protein n=1 Tax=Stigmatella aurantiaca (strain DW4/3-1) TaxID=378806 RepID=E3FKS6_STIAD|nr:uncharacterized protein STAUR_1440 [Stigmatella aurantiaca DW4/3-1]
MRPGVMSVVAGNEHSRAVSGDGREWTWGNNGYDLLGDGLILFRIEGNVPVVSGECDDLEEPGQPGGGGPPELRTRPLLVPGTGCQK